MIKRIYEFLGIKKFGNKISKSNDSTLRIHKSVKLIDTSIILKGTSKLFIDKGVQIISSQIKVSDNSTVFISKDCVIQNTIINCSEKGNINLEEGCIINFHNDKKIKIIAAMGNIFFGYRVKSYADLILCRFNGKLTIGQYTGISNGSEIIVEEKIEIGEFVLVSYDVCIYDTNSHSLDAIERRKGIIEGYPGGLWDTIKPKTKPIKIGNDVWIGKGSTVTKGANIPNETIIGLRTNYGSLELINSSVVVSQSSRILEKGGSNS